MRRPPASRRIRILSFAAAALCAAGLSLVPALSGCAAVLDAARQRLAVLGIAFDAETVDVSRLVYPSSILDVASLGRYGVDVRVGIKAKNRKPYRAVFDGAAAKLRVRKTSPSDPAVTGSIPAFAVEGNAETAFEVTFPLRLDSPVFTKAVWKDIIHGEDTPYQVDAEIPLHFPEGLAPIKDETVRMTVVADKVNVREKSGTVVQALLKALDLAF